MPIFAFTIFVGAFLLFQLQPLMGKYILPWFGGTPAVWTTCLLFFQAALFGGYAYAHFITKWLKPRSQVIVHTLLAAVSLAFLPIIPSAHWKPTGLEQPVPRILALLACSIGLPYFILSATGPLLQHWHTKAFPNRSPFRLYALSNVASLLALLSFPIFFETHFTRIVQAQLWGWGLVVYAVGCALCARNVWKIVPIENATAKSAARSTGDSAVPPSRGRRLLWILLAACASALLLATTNKMCQEIAVVPFLWVIPLSLYLLSFIIAFDSPRWYGRMSYALILPVAWVAVCWILMQGIQANIYTQIIIYSVSLFVFCMVCHGELYRLKPAPVYLTSFYLCISGGGVLGGLAVAVVSPLVFKDFYEYQLGILFCGLLFLWLCFRDKSPKFCGARRAGLLSWLVLGLLFCAIAFWSDLRRDREDTAFQSRNFYGVLTVKEGGKDQPEYNHMRLIHGHIIHGLEFVEPAKATIPTLYYHENSGVGLAFGLLPAGNHRIGLVGLGVGTLAAYAKNGDYLHVYEINRAVVRLASSRFSFLSRCPASIEITTGDARLSLERETPQNFDMLVLDAFNSDSIPVHLLTSEAFHSYERHLHPDGVLAIHVSNRSLNLDPVVEGLARQYNYGFVTIDAPKPPDKPWLEDSIWMILSRTNTLIDAPAMQIASRPSLGLSTNIPLWTDDFASLFQILLPLQHGESKTAIETVPVQQAAACVGAGDYAGAIKVYRDVLKEHPNDVVFLNNLSFVLATCPDATFKDPAEAVRLGEKACQLSHYHVTFLVGTLGAAYSMAGRFEDAASMAQKAIYMAAQSGEESLGKRNKELLELYRTHQGYRESEGAEAVK